MGVLSRIASKRSTLTTKNTDVTTAAQLTLRQSLWPLSIVTILFFLWVCKQHTSGAARTRPSDNTNKSLTGTAEHIRWRLSDMQTGCFATGGRLARAQVHENTAKWLQVASRRLSGLGSLETAANPYLSVCGPPRYSELRINFAQAFNAIGTVIGPVLGSFKDTGDSVAALKNVQWVYLGIAIFVFLLAFVFFISHIPEVTDADMEFQVQETHVGGSEKPFWKQYRLFHAAFAQFSYTGAQIAIASYFINYAVDTRPGTDSATGAKLLAGAQGAFAVGRFSGTFLMKFVKPRYVFLAYLTGVVAFLGAATGARQNAGIAMLYLTLYFESICFPTIVALGIRGLGRHYKRGSGFIVGGVCGGACIPSLLGKVADMHNDTGIAMIVPTAFMIAAETYALAVNFVPAYRIPADMVGSSTIGIQTAQDTGDVEKSEATGVARGIDGSEVVEIQKLEAGHTSIH
ncbi:hypothetical protein PV05_07199 [Exophiala xenobiotica]|uniref:Major facilitator superfamily (MFS) profile domain-containing protein n=1 Tax=Exophiala xenobiotica TaxID=348802 RepID=A0A0D2CXG3_9EURO|nr:uncharacterized protein PV05_07199 [Exophiala xenobiotica]KIW54867.1 hypothetical protein PV05_07199 [Exophiala xenobiotica]